MKKGKIEFCKLKRELETGNHAGSKVFNVRMDNGDKGEVFISKGNPEPQPGDELEYEVEVNQYGTKLKTLKKSGGFKGKSPEERNSIEAQTALKCAVEYHTQRQGDPYEVTTTAGIFLQFLHNELVIPEKEHHNKFPF